MAGEIEKWFKPKNEDLKEAKEFKTFFPKYIPDSGILTKPGIQLGPLWHGALLVPESIKLQKKLLEGKLFSNKEIEEVMEASRKSISGTYEWLEGEELPKLKIKIDNLDIFEHLSAGTDFMVAFLEFEGEEKRLRYISATSKKSETQESSMIFGFPQIIQVPEQSVRLYLRYPKPENERTPNDYFSRQCLFLFPHKNQSSKQI